MTTIVVITTGLTGMLKASCALSKSLAKEGFRVIYACPFDHRGYVESQGLNYQQLEAIAFDPQPGLTSDEVIQAWKFDAYDELLRTEQPSLVIIDQELHELILFSYSRGHAFVLLNQWFPISPSWNSPSLKSYYIPGTSYFDKFFIGSSWIRLLSLRRFINLKKKWVSKGKDRRSILLQYAHNVNFPTDHLNSNGWPPPYTYDGIPTLSMNNASLDFDGNGKPLDIYIGAQIDEERQDDIHPEVDKALDRLFSELGTQRLIYCTLSSMQASDVKHIRSIINVVSSKEDWMLIISLGDKTPVSSLGELPNNVRAFKWLPQLEVLSKAAISINHGGIHTINECIHFKVPMLVYSGEKYDQNGCAARVHHKGIGIMGKKNKDSEEEIMDHLERLMNDPYFQENLDHQYKQYVSYGSNGQLKEIINQLIDSKPWC